MNSELLRVMFVDDEKKTRKLLAICIDWTSLGYEVTQDAASANEALELISTEKPDVIITDIEMPFINGLDFAQIVRVEYPNIKVLVLTAHNAFDYAQKGVDIGISGFLLKPIKRDKIIQVMSNIRYTILEEKKQINEYINLKNKLKDNWDYIVQSFLNDMMINSYSKDELCNKFNYYKLPLDIDGGYFNIILLAFDLISDVEDNVLMTIKIHDSIKTITDDIPGVITFLDIHQNIVVLSGNRKINLYSYDSYFTTMIYQKFNITINTGIGKPVEELFDIRMSYKYAYKMLQIEKFSQDKVLNINYNSESEYTHFSDIIHDIEDNLSLYLKIPIKEKVIDQINTIFNIIQDNFTISFSNIIVIAVSIINVMLNTISEMGISFNEIYATDSLPYKHILKLKDIESVKNYILNFAEYTTQKIEKFNQSASNKLINNILEYINDNISDCTLSCKRISEIFYVNSSYLSRMFKTIVGNTFSDYLKDIRIEKAKKFLTGTNLKIYEIAEQIGINDPNYFSKYFKKHTNYTPAQYKKEFTN
ncbi:response regulator transcription factor [Vallitalea sediminicola]